MSGCATQSSARVQPEGEDTARQALERFSSAWNDAAFDALEASFLPARRPVIARHRERIEMDMRLWAIDDWRLEELCHPRGVDWKTARVTRVARHVRQDEVVWLVQRDGTWWMYAL